MECPCRWTDLYLLIYLSIHVANVFCQNIPLERTPPEVSTQPQTGNLEREVIQTLSPSNAQLINALLSCIAAKGLKPKPTQIIQSTLPQEQPQITTSQNAPKLLNIVPLQPQISSNCEKKAIIVSSIPAESVNTIPNQVSSSTVILPPKLQTGAAVSWMFPPKTCQGGCLENCACPQPSRAVWQNPQSSQPVTAMNSCYWNQPEVLNETPPSYANLQITPPTRILTPINTECSTVENLNEPSCGTLFDKPLLVTCDGKPGIPTNLQINIPSPTDLCPTIPIGTTAPTNPEPVTDFSPYAFPPPPPIIMKTSRSRLRQLLPILLLLALIDDCGSCGRYGCPYNNCDSDDPIPIFFPIPVPVNNVS